MHDVAKAPAVGRPARLPDWARSPGNRAGRPTTRGSLSNCLGSLLGTLLPIQTVALLVLACPAPAPARTASPFRISPHEGAFFVQDNLVNRRLLDLEPGGAYRQIDVDRTSAVETDRGTWEQDAQGAILLHPTRDALRFRALTSGPLSVVLDRPGVLAALPALADTIRSFLAQSEDDVFAAADLAQIVAAAKSSGVPALALSVDPKAETLSRLDLVSLTQQIDDLRWSERTNTYILSPVLATSPPLLVLQDARFQARDLAEVRRAYHVARGQAPPFYFARVNAKTFAQRAGDWQALGWPGVPD
jgi:hypothetical protein